MLWCLVDDVGFCNVVFCLYDDVFGVGAAGIGDVRVCTLWFVFVRFCLWLCLCLFCCTCVYLVRFGSFWFVVVRDCVYACVYVQDMTRQNKTNNTRQ